MRTSPLVFIAVTGAIAFISVNFSKHISATNGELSIISSLNYFLLRTVIIYLIRTVWLSINALKRKNYDVLGFKEVLLNQGNTKKDLILSIINKTRTNYNAINSKVNNMTLAQKFFQRAIFLFLIYVLSVFLQYSKIKLFIPPEINLILIYKEEIFLLFVFLSILFLKLFLILGILKLLKE